MTGDTRWLEDPRLDPFEEIWAIDTEFTPQPGERVVPLCLAAREQRTGRRVTIGWEELSNRAPYSLGEESLIVAYSVVAELSFHLALGWELPRNVLDLYPEYRWLFNGKRTQTGHWDLFSALTQFNLQPPWQSDKAAMQQLAIRGGIFSAEEREALQAYCFEDVLALEALLPAMVPLLDKERCRWLHRGRYQCVVAKIEFEGTPINTEIFGKLERNRASLKSRLIADVDRDFGVFKETSFNLKLFGELLEREGISWPTTKTGRLRKDRDTFRDMASAFPQLRPLQQLTASLSLFRKQSLQVGMDGRNRTALCSFGTCTARNAPSTTKYIFNLSTWLRLLIEPPEGFALVHLDWHAQEYAIASALSKDPLMMDNYRSGDPYLAVGKQLGLLPPDATKASAGPMRNRLKVCALAMNYGMKEHTLSSLLQISEKHAEYVLEQHRELYQRYWAWSNAKVVQAWKVGRICSPGGWQFWVRKPIKEFTLRNFPVQSAGSDCLQRAAVLISEAGIKITALVHDALMIIAPLTSWKEEAARTEALMQQAAAEVLGGFVVRTEAKEILPGDRYHDPRGEVMYEYVLRNLA